MIYRYKTTVMRRTPGIHEHRQPGEGHAPDYLSDIEKKFHAPPGGGKSLGQKVLRPQPKPKAASVKIQGGGMTCCHPLKR